MSHEDPLDWIDRRTQELSEALGSGVLSAVLRWLRARFLPFPWFALAVAKQIASANELCAVASEGAVDAWVAEQAGIEVEDLPEVEEQVPEYEAGRHADDFAKWDEELGVDLLAEERRLAEAIDTIFEGEEDQIGHRMQRLAKSEPVRVAKERMRLRMKARGVTEYVRVVAAGACEACADRVGEVRDVDTPFTDHPGCRCSLRPKVAQGWGDEVKARAFQLRKITKSGVRVSSGLVFSNEREGKVNG